MHTTGWTARKALGATKEFHPGPHNTFTDSHSRHDSARCATASGEQHLAEYDPHMVPISQPFCASAYLLFSADRPGHVCFTPRTAPFLPLVSDLRQDLVLVSRGQISALRGGQETT
jgi:hypothetical protein